MKVSISHKKNTDQKMISCSREVIQNTSEYTAFFRKLGKSEKEGCQILLDTPTNADMLCLAVSALHDGAYSFSREYLRQLNPHEIFEKRDLLADYGKGEFTFLLSEPSTAELYAIDEGSRHGICKGYARTLGNLPNNYLHTENMEAYALRLADDLNISCQILHDQELLELGCGGLLAVNQGSRRQAAMIILNYQGSDRKEPPVALVGKGLMFDSGGYHLKSINGMNGMKYDMCGAAGVLEALELLVRKKVKRNLTAILLLGENVISPDALKMGDVITTLSGKTVEIYNTDAEGRLVLADGLTYAQNHNSSLIIDLATLTYSAQAALGDSITGLFCNDEEIYGHWSASAQKTCEKFWRLPLDPSYHRQLEWSICADFANYAPGKGGGAGIAACFLENFIRKGTKWIHLDMVGPSVVRSETDEMTEGASGVCIDTIVEFICTLDKNNA